MRAYTSVSDVRDRVEPGEFVYYDERDPCYTWCFPLRFGPFDPTAAWRRSALPALSTDLTMYIHIPYCTFICSMCPFTHEPLVKRDLDAYVDALITEIEHYAKHPLARARRTTTIYFGGGTASSLRPHHLERILAAVRTGFVLSEDCEITLECHPRTVDRDYMERARALGVNRISFGIQSFNQDNIRSLKLHQQIPQSREILQEALGVGFGTVAIDIMYRYPSQNIDSLKAELLNVFELGVHGLSVYALDPEVRDMRRARARQPAITVEEQMYYFFLDTLSERGWRHLAQPDYALPGHENLHLRDIWGAPQADNLSFGAGAFTQSWNGATWCNVADSNAYIAAIESGHLPVLMGQTQSWDDAVARYFALGVRCFEVPFGPFQEAYLVDPRALFALELERLAERGWIEVDEEKVSVTRKGKFYIDNISKTFYNPANRGKPQPWGQILKDLRPERLYERSATLEAARGWEVA